MSKKVYLERLMSTNGPINKKIILTGEVLWSYDYELLERTSLREIASHFSGVSPFHAHQGEISLMSDRIIFRDESELTISLTDLEQLYMGFDDNFPGSSVKNFGLFWQPLRLTLCSGQQLYLIIDYNVLGSKNQLWFDTIKIILEDRY